MPALLAAVTLSGCAFAPGGHLDYRADSAPVDDLVDIEPITLGLVRAQRDTTPPREIGRVSDELRSHIDSYDYRIGKGDVLSVIVYDHPELTIPAGSERSAAESGNTVHSDGTIFYPYIGRVEVEGLTVAEVRDIIAQRLTSFIAEPQVEVRLADFNSQKVFVTGEVVEPGRLPITNVPLTVLDAISHAGGLGEMANWHEVILTRQGEDHRISLYDMLNRGDLEQNMLLRDGDVLHIGDNASQQVYVMGEVNEVRNVPIGRSRVSLTDALTRAGGFNEAQANARGIFVIRQAAATSDKLATVYQLDARNAAAMMLGTEFMLQPNDIIYVTTTPLGRWNRVVSQLLPTVTAVYQTTRTLRDIDTLRDDF
ncbi:polysaccharide export protein Wza [Halomonas sp. 1513]|nr:polysaccharide export protein Wza [Halomonas sp. 1513]